MVDYFIEYIQIEKRYSQHTVSSYKKDLEDFILFLNENKSEINILQSEKKDIRNFIIHLGEKNISKRSINRKISTLRSFFKFMLKINEIDKSPLEGIDSLKFYAKKQIPISVEEMENLNILMSENTPVLDRLIVETLYQTGMRRSELCSLTLEKVNLQRKELLVLGKGGKQRLIPISEDLSEQFQNYLSFIRPSESIHNYFFSRYDGKSVTEKFVYSLVNRYLSLVTSKDKKSPHMLRHSFATHILNNGAEISKVKQLMGHSSLASTQVYTEASIEQLKKVFNKAHPRGDEKLDKKKD